MTTKIISQPHGATVGDAILNELSSGQWTDLRWAVAFAKLSGVSYLDGPLRNFVAAGGHAVLSVGVDLGGTSFEAASQLSSAVAANGLLVITKVTGAGTATYHPKAYLFRRLGEDGTLESGLLVSGSNNLTQGGLFENHEFATLWRPDLSNPSDFHQFNLATESILAWQNVQSGVAIPATIENLLALHRSGDLPTEAAISKTTAGSKASKAGDGTSAKPPSGFKAQPKQPKPKHPRSLGPPLVALPAKPTIGVESEVSKQSGGDLVESPATNGAKEPAASAASTHSAFFIDTSTTAMTELYLSKTALDDDPAFFGHPFTGLTTPKKATSYPQPERDPKPIVDIRLIDSAGGEISVYQDHELKIWQYSNGPKANQDVRVTVPAELMRALPDGCILEMRRKGIRKGIEYRLDFLTPGSPSHAHARSIASNPLPGGKRKWGWE